MKVNIELPFFPGLYESDLYSCDTSYWAIKDELDYYHNELREEHPEYQSLTEDDLDFDFDAYSRDIVDGFVDAWKSYAPEIVESVENHKMVSPRYYNFETDRIFADVELREDWKDVMRGFIMENYDWLQNRIHEDWTSYDGFCSFMDNDIDEWDKHLFEEEDDRYISTMLGYMMYIADKDIRNDLVMCTLEDTYAGFYVFITDEAKDRIEEDIREGRVQLPDPAQMEIPFTE